MLGFQWFFVDFSLRFRFWNSETLRQQTHDGVTAGGLATPHAGEEEHAEAHQEIGDELLRRRGYEEERQTHTVLQAIESWRR